MHPSRLFIQARLTAQSLPDFIRTSVCPVPLGFALAGICQLVAKLAHDIAAVRTVEFADAATTIHYAWTEKKRPISAKTASHAVDIDGL